MKLKFGKGNAKLSKSIGTFSLPAGRTCPGANECKAFVSIVNGKRKVVDGPETVFRCFAASDEARYPKTYDARRFNFEKLKAAKTTKNMVALITRSLPKADYIRIHVSGDFFSQTYFDAWCQVARDNPSITFYAYTKSIPFWLKRIGKIPENLSLTASVGGRYDSLIDEHDLINARVVNSEQEAADLGLPIDHDDSYAIAANENFALLLHGGQPKGSEAAKALVKLRKAGKGGYSK